MLNTPGKTRSGRRRRQGRWTELFAVGANVLPAFGIGHFATFLTDAAVLDIIIILTRKLACANVALMPRKMRVESPVTIYHVISQGDHHEDVFLDEVGRQDFLKTLAVGMEGGGWLSQARRAPGKLGLAARLRRVVRLDKRADKIGCGTKHRFSWNQGASCMKLKPGYG